MSRHVACGLSVLALTGCLSAAAAQLSGIDLQYADRSVRPQDDLYRYLNGKWLDNFQLPPDKASYGSFTSVRDATLEQLRTIVEELGRAEPLPKSHAAAGSADPGMELRKLAD